MKTVKCILLTLLVMGFVMATFAASDAVEPAQLTLTHLREEGTKSASSVTFWRGDTILLTNCTLYNATTTNGAVQGLSNVTVTVTVGTTALSTLYTGTVDSVTGGTYWVSVSAPTTGTVFVETTITDDQTNSYTYGWKSLSLKDKL